MPEFGTKSRERLSTAHGDLQYLFNKVVRHVDCTILEGYRNEARQSELFMANKSKLRWPESRHNRKPSMAVDVAPYPIPKNWDERQFYFFAGQVKMIAQQLGMGDRLRWGGDWDCDGDVTDQTFNDLVHFELTS